MSCRRSITLGAALFLLSAAAHALPITFSFSSTVSDVTPPLAGIAAVGDTIRGTFTFDPTALSAPSDAPGMRAIYPEAGATLTLTVGDYTARATGFYITILNDWIADGVFLGDRFIVATTAESQIDAPTVGEYAFGTFSLAVIDPTGTMLDSAAIPTDTSPFEGRSYDSAVHLGFQKPLFLNAFLGAGVRAEDVTLGTVPEPNTIALLGVSLFSLCLATRRRIPAPALPLA
ncbi:hypothetical protein Tchl_1995 [Thauera chlorobenzoica]|uniref:Ice-binding protein C-terminal domain-containing protein n=2 Tax=Thauera chlorobenzoica TaxID=96773 RepID=A0A1L6FD54_9RHOO|nr:hypothetical protein Tchl_1995 [Thauera chlorobenzoica]